MEKDEIQEETESGNSIVKRKELCIKNIKCEYCGSGQTPTPIEFDFQNARKFEEGLVTHVCEKVSNTSRKIKLEKAPFKGIQRKETDLKCIDFFDEKNMKKTVYLTDRGMKIVEILESDIGNEPLGNINPNYPQVILLWKDGVKECYRNGEKINEPSNNMFGEEQVRDEGGN